MKNLTSLKGFLLAILGLCLAAPSAEAQIPAGELGGTRVVFSSIPFLRITPDARAGGMGDVGLATSPDAASIYWNSAKLAFIENDMGAQLTYTPWLRNLVDDIFITQISGYKRIDELSTFGASFRYFSLGQINFTDIVGNDNGSFNPNELAVDVAYARKLSDNMGIGLNLKYVYSNLAQGVVTGGNTIKPANAIAADISTYYNKDIVVGGAVSELAFGAAITNIGNKVSYTDDEAQKDFIPINLGLGAGYTAHVDEYNKVSIALEFNKLLVPTPDSTGTFRDKALISGMLGSFNDAPDGFSEEMQEITFSVGLEYWYNDQFAVRVGHFNEHQRKGNRKYINLGLGLKYNVFGLDFSYLIPTVETGAHPLQNTLRFGLLFDLNGGISQNEDI